MPSLNKAMAAWVCCLVITVPATRVMMADLLALDANEAEKLNAVSSSHVKASDAAEKTSQGNDCSTISKEVRGMEAAGAKFWEGVYKCLHKDGRVVLIQCDMDDGPRIHGSKAKQAACWVKENLTEKPDDLTKFLNGVTGAITSVADTIASLVMMPTTKTTADLDAAIATFATDDAATLHQVGTYLLEKKKATLHQALDDKWDGLNAFEKEFTVSVLSSVVHQTSQASSLELSEVSGESEVADLKGENFFTFLLKLIEAVIKGNQQKRQRAAANKYMSMNIGWDHVRSNMRRDGWRW